MCTWLCTRLSSWPIPSRCCRASEFTACGLPRSALFAAQPAAQPAARPAAQPAAQQVFRPVLHSHFRGMPRLELERREAHSLSGPGALRNVAVLLTIYLQNEHAMGRCCCHGFRGRCCCHGFFTKQSVTHLKVLDRALKMRVLPKVIHQNRTCQ